VALEALELPNSPPSSSIGLFLTMSRAALPWRSRWGVAAASGLPSSAAHASAAASIEDAIRPPHQPLVRAEYLEFAAPVGAKALPSFRIPK
jgi:hypothetical protein